MEHHKTCRCDECLSMWAQFGSAASLALNAPFTSSEIDAARTRLGVIDFVAPTFTVQELNARDWDWGELDPDNEEDAEQIELLRDSASLIIPADMSVDDVTRLVLDHFELASEEMGDQPNKINWRDGYGHYEGD